jgi:hypothetical protein
VFPHGSCRFWNFRLFKLVFVSQWVVKKNFQLHEVNGGRNNGIYYYMIKVKYLCDDSMLVWITVNSEDFFGFGSSFVWTQACGDRCEKRSLNLGSCVFFWWG